MESRIIKCRAKQFSSHIGNGNRLVLFEGDQVAVSRKAVRERKHQVLDGTGRVIGYISKEDIRGITMELPRRRKHALEIG